MQALYLLGTRQITSLQAEIGKLDEPLLNEDPASANGHVVAGLAALQRTIDDYDLMARRELVDEKKGKAESRVERFREDYSALRQQFERVKQSQASDQAASDRASLLGRSGAVASSSASSSSMPHSRFARSGVQGSQGGLAESPFTLPARQTGPASGYGARTDAALSDHSFINSTGSMLDQYISQGQAILGNLGTQRDTLKGTQRRLLSAANTLGLSRSTISFIERRSRGDMAVLACGAIGTLVCFWYIIRWFG